LLVLENNETYINLVKKSKFIGKMFPVFSKDDCENKISEIKEKFKDATHICYAYILTNPPSEKCYDDGEPKGTAGLPIINVLKRQKLKNVLVVVVRYFGGVKLGAGGLIKAYMETCIGLIKKAEFVDYKKYHIYEIAVLLSDMQIVISYFNSSELILLNSDFNKLSGNVVYTIASIDELNEQAINYILSLKGDITKLQTKFLSEKEIQKIW